MLPRRHITVIKIDARKFKTRGMIFNGWSYWDHPKTFSSIYYMHTCSNTGQFILDS